jgi:hypothetical protein
MLVLDSGDTVAVTHDQFGRIITLSSSRDLCVYDLAWQQISKETLGWSRYPFASGELQYRQDSLFLWFSRFPLGLRHIAYKLAPHLSWQRARTGVAFHLVNPTALCPDGVAIERAIGPHLSQMLPMTRYMATPKIIHLAEQNLLCFSRGWDLTLTSTEGTLIRTIAASVYIPHNIPRNLSRTTLLSPDGTTFYLLTRKTIAAISVTGNNCVKTAKYLKARVYYAQQRPVLSPDGKNLVIQIKNGPLLFLDPLSFRLNQSYNFQTRGVSFSPDGLTLAMATANGTVLIDC